jgi:hypothetical protein
MKLISVVAAVGSCGGVGTIVCSLGSIARGGNVTIALSVQTPLTPRTVSNTATVSTAEADPNPANNAATSLMQTVDPASIPALSECARLALAAMLALFAVAKMRG